VSGHNRPPRVLVVDKRAVIGVDICRAVAAQGCIAEVFASSGSSAFRSRFCATALIAPEFEDRRRFMQGLDAVVHGGEPYDAIHVCNEEVLASLIPMLGASRWQALLIPPRTCLETALSKNAMIGLAAETGVATPETVIPQTEDEIETASRELGFPIVIKGDTGESGEAVRVVSDLRALRRIYEGVLARESRAGSRPALQQFVGGPAYSIGGLYHRGQPVRVVCHEKLVRYPHPYGGKTVRGITAYVPELLREVFKVFEALEYTGLGHIEFIRDERDGAFKFLEVNPRPWGTIGVAEDAGVDLFTPYRKIVAGDRVVPDLRFRSGVLFHRFRREANLIRAKPARLFGLLHDVLDPRVRSDFRWGDPFPHFPSILAKRSGRPKTPPLAGTPDLARQ
jgi:hypothetical protein